jgi:hypothetical protein
MATEQNVVDLTFDAGADLSSDQHKFVKISADDTVILCAAATDVPAGVLQNAPDAAGKAATVRVLGLSKVSADAALTAGNLIGTSADGQADVKVPGTDTTEYVVGQVKRGVAAAGSKATAMINCINPHRAA